jgi:hypothetical protein
LAFLRFSRDKRGYEHFYLVEPTANRRGKVRARVLYWFRTPPNVRVGREPFDRDARTALEAQNPNVAFDWRRIVETPIPSADAERWRERRREERAAARRMAFDRGEAAEADAAATGIAEREIAEREIPEAAEGGERRPAGLTTPVGPVPPVGSAAGPGERGARRRRRRRRGRRGRSATSVHAQEPATQPGESVEDIREPADSGDDEPN